MAHHQAAFPFENMVIRGKRRRGKHPQPVSTQWQTKSGALYSWCWRSDRADKTYDADWGASSRWQSWENSSFWSSADQSGWQAWLWQRWWERDPWTAGEHESDKLDGDWIMEPSGKHLCTLILIHSCCGKPSHMAGMFDDLRGHGMFDEHHLRVIAPAAPRRITKSDNRGTRQWFEYRMNPLLESTDQYDIDTEQLLEQRHRLSLLLHAELQRLPLHGRLVLGGLSQGASMIADLLLHLDNPFDARLRGAFFKRGFVHEESVDDLPVNGYGAGLAQLSMLATHGVDDELVALHPARSSYRLLEQRGGAVAFHEIPGLTHNGHSHAEALIFAKFIRDLLCPDN